MKSPVVLTRRHQPRYASRDRYPKVSRSVTGLDQECGPATVFRKPICKKAACGSDYHDDGAERLGIHFPASIDESVGRGVHESLSYSVQLM